MLILVLMIRPSGILALPSNGVCESVMAFLNDLWLVYRSVFEFALIGSAVGLSMDVVLRTGLLSLASAGFMAIGADARRVADDPSARALAARPRWRVRRPAASACCWAARPAAERRLSRHCHHRIWRGGAGVHAQHRQRGGAHHHRRRGRARTTSRGRRRPGILAPFVGVLVYLFIRIDRSRTGRGFDAIRQDPQVAASMGIDVVRIAIWLSCSAH